MKILIDTNVMLDFLAERKPYFSDSDAILNLCKENKVSARIAAHSVMDAFYILRKEYTSDQRRQMLLRYIQIVPVIEINMKLIMNALKRKELILILKSGHFHPQPEKAGFSYIRKNRLLLYLLQLFPVQV